jgi:hypothetical protein
VQYARGDHLVGRSGIAQQHPDLDRVHDERRAIGRAMLVLVQLFGVGECRLRLGESRCELRGPIRAYRGREP